MLVLIGATPEGVKELIGFQTGMRENAQSWRELLVDLKARGLSIAPELAIGDGALGLWNALDEALPTTRHQRCWLHKTTNVLDNFPKSLQPKAHKDLREIRLAPDGVSAAGAMTTFAEKYAPKYDKAVDCLIKDRVQFPRTYRDVLRRVSNGARLATPARDNQINFAILGLACATNRFLAADARCVSSSASIRSMSPAF